MDEAQVIERIKSGDMNAFDELFNIYKNTAVRTAYLITGNLYTGEDVVQEVFVKCWFKIKTLKSPESFKPWFYRILTRTAWKHSKSDKKITPVEDIYEKADRPVADKYSTDSEYDIIYSEIDRLNIKLKTTVILFYFNDLSVKETAKALGITEGTVKSRLHKARTVLKDRLYSYYAVNDYKGVRKNETVKE